MMPIVEPMLPMAATVVPTLIPPTMTPFMAASITQHHTLTGAAIIEQHVEQTVVHETHVGKQIVHERHIDQPVIHERHIDQPVIHERHIDQPVIHERHYEQPVIHERHIDKPIIHERHIDKPIIHERHIEKPIIHEKHYEQPVIHEKHIVKPVFHEVHINRPVIHETIVAPARVEVMNHTEQTLIDQQYTTAAAIVHTEHASLPAQITVEHSVAPPIMAGSTLTAHSMPRSPTVLSAPRSPSSTMSSCSSMSVTSLEAGAYVMPVSPLVSATMVCAAPTYTLGGCQEVIVVNEPPMKPLKAEKQGHRHHLKQKLDQKLHRHH